MSFIKYFLILIHIVLHVRIGERIKKDAKRVRDILLTMKTNSLLRESTRHMKTVVFKLQNESLSKMSYLKKIENIPGTTVMASEKLGFNG